jgi:short-subunit dehydrogenase
MDKVHSKPLAVVTGASSGIGFEIAKLCAENGFDLVIAANESKISDAACTFRQLGSHVHAVAVDLATLQGVSHATQIYFRK